MLHLSSCEYAPPEVLLKELHVDETGMAFTLGGTAVRMVAEGLVEQFHKDGGINYVEWNIHREDEGWFVLTMHRRGAKSPGNVAHERQLEIDRLSALLIQHGIEP
jgi:hypothetical protein